MRPGGGLWHDHRSPAALAARCFDEHARPHPHPAQDAQRRPMSVPQPRVREVRTGRVRTLARPGVRSAIDKQPVDGPIAVGALGLAGDEQGDLAIHGGPDKAVHLYAWLEAGRRLSMKACTPSSALSSIMLQAMVAGVGVGGLDAGLELPVEQLLAAAIETRGLATIAATSARPRRPACSASPRG
jgi:hypothetical protein